MSGKAGSKRAGDPVGRTRRGANIRHASPSEDATCGTLPLMHASVRRRSAVRTAEAARPPRKIKRAKRAPTLGGRLAAAIRMTRLRAGRAAEEFGRR